MRVFDSFRSDYCSRRFWWADTRGTNERSFGWWDACKGSSASPEACGTGTGIFVHWKDPRDPGANGDASVVWSYATWTLIWHHNAYHSCMVTIVELDTWTRLYSSPWSWWSFRLGWRISKLLALMVEEWRRSQEKHPRPVRPGPQWGMSLLEGVHSRLQDIVLGMVHDSGFQIHDIDLVECIQTTWTSPSRGVTKPNVLIHYNITFRTFKKQSCWLLLGMYFLSIDPCMITMVHRVPQQIGSIHHWCNY